MSLCDQTLEQKVLDKKIIELENKIVSAGDFISTITENCFSYPITNSNGQVIADDPISSANEIIEAAKEIKQMAIQYETLIDLDSEISDTQKVAESEPTTTPDTIND